MEGMRAKWVSYEVRKNLRFKLRVFAFPLSSYIKDGYMPKDK